MDRSVSTEPTRAEAARWLRLSVGLFLYFGVLNVVVGVLAPVFYRGAAEPPARILFFSERSDTALFGRSPAQLLREDDAVATLRQLTLYWEAALFLSFGLLQLAVTWFGLRTGRRWALWALTTGDLATLPYWAAMLQVYLRSGAPLGPGDLPPLVLSLALIPVAALLGWRGLYPVGGEAVRAIT